MNPNHEEFPGRRRSAAGIRLLGQVCYIKLSFATEMGSEEKRADQISIKYLLTKEGNKSQALSQDTTRLIHYNALKAVSSLTFRFN